MALVLLISSDIMFQAKIQETAKHFSVEVLICHSADEAKEKMKLHPALTFLDLGHSGIDPLSFVKEVKGSETLKANKILAFGPHVERDLIAAMKHVGCDIVMPRSRFHLELPQILGDLK